MLTTMFGERDVIWEQECQHPADADASVPQVSPTTADALARLLGLPLSTTAGLLEEYGSLTRLRRASPDALRRGGLTPRRAAQMMAALYPLTWFREPTWRVARAARCSEER